jgi:hypothetical protein
VEADDRSSERTRPGRNRPREVRTDDGAMWDVHDVAHYLKTTTSWVYQEQRAGRLPGRRLGSARGHLRFEPADIRAYARGEWKPEEAA